MAIKLGSRVAAVRPARRARRAQFSLLRPAGYLTMALVTAIIAVPLLWMLSTALKDTPEIYRKPITLLPESLRWSNFRQAWEAKPFGRFYINSIVVTTALTLSHLVNAVLCAYALVFLRFPFKRVLFMVVLGAMMVPGEVTIVPNYLLMAQLGWVDTYAGLIVPALGVALGVFLLRQAFLTIPRELIEAARIDGAGHLRILWSIVVPVTRPTLVTVALIYVVSGWNSYLWPLIITNSLEMRTLPVGLRFLLDTEGNTRWGIVMAGALIVVAPVVMFFVWMQRHLIAGLTAGSIKG